MNQRRLGAFCLTTLIFAWPVAGCGDYSQPGSAGGGAGMSGKGGTGGTTAGTGGTTAGTGGTTAGTGGTTAGTGGTTAGTGGAAGSSAGTAGSSAGASGTAGSAGTAGAGGSGGGTASCDTVAPCGGDVVGTWTAVDCPTMVTGMVDLSGFGLHLDCLVAPITTGSMEVTGTLTLNADGTYADQTITAAEVVFELPSACLILSGTVTACDSIALPLSTIGFDEYGLTCLDNAATEGCTCTGIATQEGAPGIVTTNAEVEGDYTAAENKLALSSLDDDIEYSYCVAGSALTMTVLTMGRVGVSSGPVVLQK